VALASKYTVKGFKLSPQQTWVPGEGFLSFPVEVVLVFDNKSSGLSKTGPAEASSFKGLGEKGSSEEFGWP
jgi:hypothetical protein